MKHAFLFATAIVAVLFAASCSRPEGSSNPDANAVKTFVPNPHITHGSARLVGSGYSQPISLDTANKMISSYLESIHYPYVDTVIRSLSFDADSMRAYLKDTSITTLKFYLAHQLSYINGGSDRFGKNIGMRPGALTIIAVGIKDNGAVVRNTSNGVYEHALPCPNNCTLEMDAYLH